MGTFKVLVGSVTAKAASPGGWWSEIPAGSGVFSNSNANIILAAKDALNSIEVWEISPPNQASPATSTGGTASITFSLDHTAIQLDTGTVDFFALPAGFQIQTLAFKIHTSAQNGSTILKMNGSTQQTINPDNGGDRTITNRLLRLI